jgi:hypothetical protein
MRRIILHRVFTLSLGVFDSRCLTRQNCPWRSTEEMPTRFLQSGPELELTVQWFCTGLSRPAAHAMGYTLRQQSGSEWTPIADLHRSGQLHA